MPEHTRRRRLAFVAALFIGATPALQGCGDDVAPVESDGGSQETAVSSDGAVPTNDARVAEAVLVSGFDGDLGFSLPAEAGALGAGADGDGGVAIGARHRVKGARITVHDAAGTVLGSALTDDRGLVTYRPPDGGAGGVTVVLRGADGAELYDLVAQRWVPFPENRVWRAVLPRITANIGLGPLSEAWVTRYERLNVRGEGLERPVPKRMAAATSPASLDAVVSVGRIDEDALLEAEVGLARATGELARLAEALGFALDERLETPAHLHAGLWSEPYAGRAEWVDSLRSRSFSGGARGYEAGGDLPATGGIDVAMLYEVLAAAALPDGAGSGTNTPLLRAGDALVADHAADGELDCAASGGVLAMTPLTIDCFSPGNGHRVVPMLARLGLEPAVPVTGVTVASATVALDDDFHLIEQDLGGAVLATPLLTGGELGERRLLTTAGSFFGLDILSMIVAPSGPQAADEPRLVLFDFDTTGLVPDDAAPVALAQGFVGRDLGAALPPRARGRTVVRAMREEDRFLALLTDDGALHLAEGGIAAGSGADQPSGLWQTVNDGGDAGDAVAAPAVIRDFAWRRDGSLWLLDATRNCLLDLSTGGCTAPPATGLAWRMAVDPDGGVWLHSGRSLFVLGPSRLGDVAVDGSRDVSAFTPVTFAEEVSGALRIETVRFTEAFGYLTATLPPDGDRPVGEVFVFRFGGPPGSPAGIREVSSATSFLNAAPVDLEPGLFAVTELFHEEDVPDDARDFFGLGQSAYLDSGQSAQEPQLVRFAY